MKDFTELEFKNWNISSDQKIQRIKIARTLSVHRILNLKI